MRDHNITNIFSLGLVTLMDDLVVSMFHKNGKRISTNKHEYVSSVCNKNESLFYFGSISKWSWCLCLKGCVQINKIVYFSFTCVDRYIWCIGSWGCFIDTWYFNLFSEFQILPMMWMKFLFVLAIFISFFTHCKIPDFTESWCARTEWDKILIKCLFC